MLEDKTSRRGAILHSNQRSELYPHLILNTIALTEIALSAVHSIGVTVCVLGVGLQLGLYIAGRLGDPAREQNVYN